MYQKVSTDLKFVEREKKIEKFWADNNIFDKSRYFLRGSRGDSRRQKKSRNNSGRCYFLEKAQRPRASSSYHFFIIRHKRNF